MPIVKFTRHTPRLVFPGLNDFTATPTLDAVESRMRKFFEGKDAFDGDVQPQAIGWVPAMEIVETPEELTLTAELAGMDRKDVEISVDDGVLTISGEKAAERNEGDKKLILWERSYGSFQRSFTLPRTVDASKISADFEHGVLKVKMPKSAEAKNKGRKIEIGTK